MSIIEVSYFMKKDMKLIHRKGASWKHHIQQSVQEDLKHPQVHDRIS